MSLAGCKVQKLTNRISFAFHLFLWADLLLTELIRYARQQILILLLLMSALNELKLPFFLFYVLFGSDFCEERARRSLIISTFCLLQIVFIGIVFLHYGAHRIVGSTLANQFLLVFQVQITHTAGLNEFRWA